ncbi:MAG TPA: pyridoxal-phosphate dependent enzyme [Thermoanaerobaculia bacterium]|jgi:L-serine/L-threonine ammonia-lyase|nr:pyridoxal-phosphate dependent enzyme [Thermoanaerobaculia bacterium]
MALHIETPLVESRALSLSSGRPVWLKLEALQPSGSFKLRGIGLACETYHARGAKRFVCSSSGNAGLAVACAGRVLGVPVTVVVPETATERAKELLGQEGAEILVHGASWQEANELALSQVGPSDAFLHPFDDPLVWEGHATLIDEAFRSGLQPDIVLLSVGGGGLLCGVAEGLHRNGWGHVPILAVETEGAASFHQATKAGHPIELEGITSIAGSLGARCVCERAVQWWKERPIQSLLVSDRSALSACERFLADQRILVEPSCGASLAPVYERAPELEPFGTVLVVVCGGATSTIDQIREWMKEAA